MTVLQRQRYTVVAGAGHYALQADVVHKAVIVCSVLHTVARAAMSLSPIIQQGFVAAVMCSSRAACTTAVGVEVQCMQRIAGYALHLQQAHVVYNALTWQATTNPVVLCACMCCMHGSVQHKPMTRHHAQPLSGCIVNIQASAHRPSSSTGMVARAGA